MTEPLIKIQISNFCKRIDEKIHLVQNAKKKKMKNNNIINVESQQSLNNDNYFFSNNNFSSNESASSTPVLQGEDINRGLATDSSSTLANIFKGESIRHIRILMNLLSLISFIIILVDFLTTLRHFDKIKIKIDFLDNGYIISNNMLYTKFFITEGVLCHDLGQDYFPVNFSGTKESFIKEIQNELSINRNI